MKKEYKLVGKVTIPKKKRKEVKSIIQKILYLGGIREKETIEIDGRQCITAGIPKWNAREVISFNYNMFTNTSYEAGRLYLKAGSIKNPCNHDKEYDFVANLIRVVLESYSTTPCYLCCDNIPCFIVDYARVINEMIGKRLSFPNRNKMWKMYYALHMNGCENIATREILEMARTTEVEESAVEHFLTVLCVGSYEPIVPRNFCRIDKKEFENSFTLNILENIRQSMEELINTEGKEKASFVFIDEFDAFYHFEFSESVQKRLGKISGVQIFTTTHNTDLMSNDLLRPDCYFLLKDNKIKAISDLTEKELRQAHNLQQMYKAGAFNW